MTARSFGTGAREGERPDVGYVELSNNSDGTASLLVDDGDDIACVELSRHQLALLQRFCEDAWIELRDVSTTSEVQP